MKNATASASASIRPGLTVGVYASQEMYRYFSGEASYLYRAGDLKLEGSGKSVSFGAHTHLITGDFLGHFRPRGARLRPFVSFGAAGEAGKRAALEASAALEGRTLPLHHQDSA